MTTYGIEMYSLA